MAPWYRLTTFPLRLVLALCGLVVVNPAPAQVPVWSAITTGSSTAVGGKSETLATAADGSGNIFVAGYFTEQATFGATTLTSAGSQDLFVAKYVPATATWAWAVSGGGTSADAATGIAVTSTGVYITGYLTNSLVDINRVRFGGAGATPGGVPQYGAGRSTSRDLFVAKYIDQGPAAALTWTQVGGGAADDVGNAIAVSGPNVYVTGYLTNPAGNISQVMFGGTGATPGTVPQYGASDNNDIVVAKYTDNGPSATFGWSQVGGGSASESGQGIAVSGSSVYVTGNLANSTTNARGVVFGGSGTTPGTALQYGATAQFSNDLLVAKYTDNGATATLVWTQVGGGTDDDVGTGIAVSGSNVYVVGYSYNDSANSNGGLFGGTGTAPGTVLQGGASAAMSYDVLLVKYTDNGPAARVAWTQVGGGTDADYGFGIAAQGANVYVTGVVTNDMGNTQQVLFGGAGPTAGTTPQPGASAANTEDLVVAKYVDKGATARVAGTLVGGGVGNDVGHAIALGGSAVYAGGSAVPAVTFAPLSLSSPAGSLVNILGSFPDAGLLAVHPGATGTAEHVFPNPAHGGATLVGGTPGERVEILDVLGRPIGSTTIGASGRTQLSLPAGLPNGMYFVRTEQQVLRLQIE